MFGVLEKLILTKSPSIPKNEIKMNNLHIAEKFIDLAKKCWNLNYEKRPSFLEIEKELKFFDEF
jgi:hypothetical protein